MSVKEKITIFDMLKQTESWKKSHVISVENTGSNPVTLTSINKLLLKVVEKINEIQVRLDNLEARLDNLVKKNNLVE